MHKIIPTRVAKKLASRHSFGKKLLDGDLDLDFALFDFQKTAIGGGSFETAKRIFEAYLKDDIELDDTEEKGLKVIYDTTKDETMGILVDQLIKVSEDGTNADKISATTLLKEIAKGNVTSEKASKLIIKKAVASGS